MERLALTVISREVSDLSGTPLLGAAAHLDQPAVFGPAHAWSWRQIHASSMALATKLDRVATLCNLCNSRGGFLVAWLAALRRGCLQVLPPSAGPADLVAMLKSTQDPCIIVDDRESLQTYWADHARCIVHVPNMKVTRIPDTELIWQPDWNAALVRLYTSGSTGMPEPQDKTLGQLARGAQILGARLNQEIDGGLATVREVVCSVPPQHMFGIEASVMFSLVHGVSVFEGRPLLPADVAAALETCDNDAAWVATPLHLRAMQRGSQVVPHCRVVISSTMPLMKDVACAVEDLTEAPVLEIYGSTETGAIAVRRTARDAGWTPLEGVRVESGRHGTSIWGEHFDAPQIVADRVAREPSGVFSLVGRQDDLVKIGGRRASLSALNQLLQSLPGLADGVFYLPDAGSCTERLVIIHEGEALDRHAANAWLRERIDAAFLPRAIVRVDRLPRTGSGKLQRAALDKVYATWLATRRRDRSC